MGAQHPNPTGVPYIHAMFLPLAPDLCYMCVTHLLKKEGQKVLDWIPHASINCMVVVGFDL